MIYHVIQAPTHADANLLQDTLNELEEQGWWFRSAFGQCLIFERSAE